MKKSLFFSITLLASSLVSAESRLENPDWEFKDDFEGEIDASFWKTAGHDTVYGAYCPEAPGASKALVFSYQPDDPEPGHGWAERRFDIPVNAVQLEMSYNLYVPSNYVQTSGNHKNFVLWSGTYGKSKANISVSSESWPTSSGGSSPSVYIGVDGANYGHTMVDPRPILMEDGAGEWVRVHVFLDLAKYEGDYGRFEISKNGNYLTGNMHPQAVSYAKTALSEQINYAENGNFIDQGYLMGWANGGFAEETNFCIDDFSMRANTAHKEVAGGPVADQRPKLDPHSVKLEIHN